MIKRTDLEGIGGLCDAIIEKMMARQAEILRREIDAKMQAPEECKWLGKKPTPRERMRHGLSLEKDWHHCDHPTQPLGEWVCPCQGCGVACGGYRVE